MYTLAISYAEEFAPTLLAFKDKVSGEGRNVSEAVRELVAWYAVGNGSTRNLAAPVAGESAEPEARVVREPPPWQ